MYSINNKYWVCTLLFLIAFFSQLIFAISVSPLSNFEGFDSCVFKQMALCLLQDKELYVDIFDHKGPVVYFIDALGLRIGAGRWGLFMIVVLNCFLCLLTWYKIASHYIDGWKRFLPVVLTLIAYLAVMEESNQTEDWCLLPCSYSLFLLSRNLTQNKGVNNLEYFILGLGVGLISFIRLNNMAIICCVVIFMWILYLKQKLYKKLLFSVLMLILGVVSVTLAIFIWLYISYGLKGVQNMLYCSFVYNIIEYNRWHSYYDFLSNNTNHLYFIFTLLVCWFAYEYNNKGGNWLFFVLCFIFVFATRGKRSFPHYLITVIPLYALCSAYALRGAAIKYFLLAVVLLIGRVFFLIQQLAYLGDVNQAYKQLYSTTDSIINCMNDMEKRDIWNYNAEFDGLGMLQRNNLIQCNRIILNFHYYSKSFMEKQEREKFQQEKPKWVLVNPRKDYILKEDSDFISQNYCLAKEISMNVHSKIINKQINVDFYKRIY